MAFLTINGWEIPVAEVTKSTEYLGTYKRVFNGSLRDSTSAVKRKWNITTTPLTYNDAYTLRNILISNGDHFGFDNIAGNTGWDTTIGNFIVSDKGVVATSGTATWRPLEGPNNLNAIAVEKATTNLLSQNAASFETDLTGWTITSSGVTISNPSDGGYHGSKYIMFYGNASDTAFGMESPFITGISPGDQISFSWYERHNTNLSSISGSSPYNPPAIIFYNNTPTEISRVNLTNLGERNSNWHRHSITATAPANTSQIKVRIGYDLPNFQYLNHAIDAVQVEKSSFPTSFTLSTRNAVTPIVGNFTVFNKNEMSIFLTINPLEITAADFNIFAIYTTYPYSGADTSLIFLSFNNITGNVQISLMDSSIIYNNYPNIMTLSLNTFNKIGITFNSSIGKLRAFLNGLKVYETSTNYTLYSSNGKCQIGAPNYHSILFSNILVLPFAASDSFATAYTNTNTYHKIPYVTISGDIVNNQQIMCFPEVQDADYLQFSNNGTWTTGQKVKFSLLEV